MQEAIEPRSLAPGASWRSFRQVALLWLLLAVVIAGAAIFLYRERQRVQSLALLSTGELRYAAQKSPGDVNLRLRLIERYLWEERNEDALREARRTVELAPGSAMAHYLLGKSYQRARQAEPGMKALERALELDPNLAPARFLLGHGYYWNERPLPASKHFQAYVELQPADDIGFRFLGLALMRLGNLKAAEVSLQRAVELEPESSGNHQALGQFYLTRAQDRDIETAVKELLRALELNPQDRGVRLETALALERMNLLPEAASHYEAILAQTPTDPKVCYALVQLYTRLKDAPRAARYRAQYDKIVRAREASRAITANPPGEASYPRH